MPPESRLPPRPPSAECRMRTVRTTASMQAFICVYRHSRPSRRELIRTEEAAANDGRLREFLEHYNDADCHYDWGDDPGFFAATKILGKPSAASWGVCRRNVRAQLKRGDLLIWFCAKEGAAHGAWEYYFIGFSTVAHTISRRELWTDNGFAKYRNFYNVLARLENGELRQYETFHSYHDDWARRAEAPYVIFSTDESVTRLNLRSPLHVAEKPPDSRVEIWCSRRDRRVRDLERVLFGQFGITRRLRTTHPQISHPHIAIHKQIGRVKTELRNELQRLSLKLAEFIV